MHRLATVITVALVVAFAGTAQAGSPSERSTEQVYIQVTGLG